MTGVLIETYFYIPRPIYIRRHTFILRNNAGETLLKVASRKKQYFIYPKCFVLIPTHLFM